MLTRNESTHPDPTPSRPARPRTSRPRPRPRPRRRAGLGLLLSVALATGLVAVGATGATAAPAPQPVVGFATAPDPLSRYQGQVSCDPAEKPGAVALRDLLRATYGKANGGGISRACTTGGTSEHKEGRGYDWMLDAAYAPDKALADAFLAWLVGPDAQGVAAGNARRLGVQYVIWNRQTWQSWTGAWKPYTGTSPHTDHVHISLSWDGAFKRTSWWTGRAVTKVDHGPCKQYTTVLVPAYSGPNYSACARPVALGPFVEGPVLVAGQQAVAGQQLTSPSGRYRAVMQGDGNFVVYAGSRVRWHLGTHGNSGSRLVEQADGNLVLYTPANRPLWHAGTHGNTGARLVLQDDGNLVVYRADNRPVWNIGPDRG